MRPNIFWCFRNDIYHEELTHESITNSKLIRWYNINAIANRVFRPTEDLIGSLKIATPCVKLL